MMVQLAGAALAAAIRARSFGGVGAGCEAKSAMPSSSPATSKMGSAGPEAQVVGTGAGTEAACGAANGVMLSPRMSEYAVLRIMARSPEGLRGAVWGHFTARTRQVDPMGSPIQSTCDSGSGFFAFGRAVRALEALTQKKTAEILNELGRGQDLVPAMCGSSVD